ncbi:MAG: hypothetical protein WAO98_00935 [Alphaproteobacteria bacterium]
MKFNILAAIREICLPGDAALRDVVVKARQEFLPAFNKQKKAFERGLRKNERFTSGNYSRAELYSEVVDAFVKHKRLVFESTGMATSYALGNASARTAPQIFESEFKYDHLVEDSVERNSLLQDIERINNQFRIAETASSRAATLLYSRFYEIDPSRAGTMMMNYLEKVRNGKEVGEAMRETLGSKADTQEGKWLIGLYSLKTETKAIADKNEAPREHIVWLSNIRSAIGHLDNRKLIGQKMGVVAGALEKKSAQQSTKPVRGSLWRLNMPTFAPAF